MCYKDKIGTIWFTISMAVGYYIQAWSHGTFTSPNLWPDDGHGFCYLVWTGVTTVVSVFVGGFAAESVND